MQSRNEVSSFIRSTFGSVWSLELLLFLKRNSSRSWSHEEMVAGLRGSQLVVTKGVDALLAAGLIVIQDDGSARYGPASGDLQRLAEEAEALYARSPDAVRRMIIAPASGGLAAFADAFKLRKD